MHKGDRPIGDFVPASDDDNRVRDFRAEMEVQERLKRGKEEQFLLNQSLEVLRKRYSRVHHYGPSRIGMFQVQQMLKMLANKNRNEEYDLEFQSPDYQEMMKFITERRRGVVVHKPNPLTSPEKAIHFDYIVLCAILCLDEHFMEKLRLREEGCIEIDAKLKREDTYRTVELHTLHRYFIDYHMEVVRNYPEYHLAFINASGLARMFIQKEGEAFAKREEENAERQRAAMRIVDEEAKRKVKLYVVEGNQVDPRTYLDNVNRFRRHRYTDWFTKASICRRLCKRS